MSTSQLILFIRCICIVLLIASIIDGAGRVHHHENKNPPPPPPPPPPPLPLLPHPKECPNCECGIVYYERFSRTHGEYVCDDCGWGMDAVTGKVTYDGRGEEGE